MLNNITNFFNLIKTGMVKTQLEAKDVLPIGTRDSNYGGTYKPTLIEYANFVAGLVGGSNGQVLFNDADTIAGASNLYWDKINERVGIGTSTPVSQMQIVGSSNASILTLTSGTRNADIAVYGAGSLFEMGTQANYSMSFKTNSAGRMIIYGGGNVGIGTTTDVGYKLDINGAARAANGLVINAGQRLSLGGSDYGSDALYAIGGGPLDVKGYYYTRFTRANATLGDQVIQVEGQALIKGAGTTSSTTSLLAQNSAGTNVLSVFDSMYVIVQNTSNIECFQVRGFNDDATIRFTPSGGTSNIVLRSQSSSITLSTTANSFGDLRVNGSAQTLRIGTSNTSGGGVNYYSSLNGATHSHRWFHNNVEQMTLQYSGNLLINTTTDAGFKLDVNGTARVKGTGTTSATTAFTVQNSAGANLLKMADDRALFLGAFGSNNYLYFSDNGSGAAIKSESYNLIFNTRGSGNVFNFTQGGDINTASVIAQLSNLNYSVNTPTLIGAISTTNASAQLEVTSTTKGFLPPRMTNAQRAAIASPAVGLIVYCTDATEGLYVYKSTGWTFMV